MAHRTSFTSIVDADKLLEFQDAGAASPAVQEYIAAYPEDEQGLLDTMRRSYALETVFNGNPPPVDTDILQVCQRFDILWPEKQVYPESNVQTLKPHQIAGMCPHLISLLQESSNWILAIVK